MADGVPGGDGIAGGARAVRAGARLGRRLHPRGPAPLRLRVRRARGPAVAAHLAGGDPVGVLLRRQDAV